MGHKDNKRDINSYIKRLRKEGFPFPLDHHIFGNDDVKIAKFLPRTYDELTERTPYLEKDTLKNKEGVANTTTHWGQRKLLMTEVDYLTDFAEPNMHILYIGAASGIHLNYLFDLFPTLTFTLVDPGSFVIQPSDRVEIINDFMTDELAEKLECDMFISDIRLAPDNESVMKDNENQIKWARMTHAKSCMLKYRCPFYNDNRDPVKYNHYDGEIRLQCWAPRTSSETRLIIHDLDNLKDKVYDTIEWQDKFHHFNTRTRMNYYPHNINVKGLDHCYDCACEVYLWQKYKDKFNDKRDITYFITRSNKECTLSDKDLTVL